MRRIATAPVLSLVFFDGKHEARCVMANNLTRTLARDLTRQLAKNVSGAVAGTTPPKSCISVTSGPQATPTIALALGGGGARGLAHILMLEAFDELGLKPKVIAGTSIGAIFGAAYASGISAREIHAHVEVILGERFGLARELISARATSLMGLFAQRSALLKPQMLLELLMPRKLADDFAQLEIPLKIVATDFYAQEPVIFSSGPLKQAIAASMALPVIFEPVVVDERALIDGGLVNPLPFDILFGEADIVVAIDVAGNPVASPTRPIPTATEALWASSFIFERTIIAEKLKSRQPDIYVAAGTGHFQVLDFLKYRHILEAAMPAKERLKAQLARVLGAETAEPSDVATTPARPETPARKIRRRLLKARSAP